MVFFVYNFLLLLFLPCTILYFFLRLVFGKEDKKRFLEKFGFYKIKRKKNVNLIWFHACSVGEAKSIFSLIDIFLQNNYQILITSSTKMSSVYIKENFQEKVIHQFLPIDYKFAVLRFLEHWRPNIGVFVESEIWPNLIVSSKKLNIPLCLIQATFSNRTIKRWYFFKKFFQFLMSNFKFIVAQSIDDRNRICAFADIKVSEVFNMKLSSQKLDVDLKEITKIKKIFKNNKIIAALSTHSGEEKMIINTFIKVKKKLRDTVLFLQPRHPNRKKEIIQIMKARKVRFKVRSDLEYPKHNTDIYLYDTFGESGTLISLSKLIILGGTLVPIGGHNLIEPAQFGKCIICGKYYDKIKDLVSLFRKEKAIITTNFIELDQLIINLLKNDTILRKTGKNAKILTNQFSKPEKHLYNKIRYLNENNENTSILV